MQIIKGRQKQPHNWLIYSEPGMGKSSMAAKSPRPIFVGADETGELDVDRMPVPKDFNELTNQIQWLMDNDHGYKSIVIDTLDSVESLLHKHILSSEPKGKTLVTYGGGYGAGFLKAASMMDEEIKQRLKTLRDKNKMNVLILAHSTRKTEVDPIAGITYDSYQINVHSRVQNLFVDYVSCVFFIGQESYKVKDDNSSKVFASSDDRRILYTSKVPGIVAKNRFSLPPQMDFTFTMYDELNFAIEQFYSSELDKLVQSINDDELQQKVKKSIAQAKGDLSKLKTIEQRLRQKLSEVAQ